MSIVIYRADNPRRPPDWRWQRAGELVNAGGRFAFGRDDQIIRDLVRFRRMLNRCQSDTDQLAAMDASPTLFDAYSLYDATDNPTEYRWELEARLLARESPDEIFRKMGIVPNTVLTYERVFYDVLNRLDFPALITHSVIGRSVQTGLAERDYDCLWKLFGYVAGPLVLDAYIYKRIEPTAADTPAAVRAFIKDRTKETLGIKACVAAETLPISWQTRELILTIYKDMLQIEANAISASSATESILSNVGALMQAMTWHRHDSPEAPKTASALSVEDTGICLRSAELQLIGDSGKSPEWLNDMASTIRFPTKGLTNEAAAQVERN